MSLTKNEKKLFTKILGIDEQQVEDATLDEHKKQLDIYLAVPKNFECPFCGKRHSGYHDKRERVVRDRDWAENKVFVHFYILRIRCCKDKTPIEIEPARFVKKNTGTQNVFES